MELFTPENKKVRFSFPKNGYDHDTKYSLEHLQVGAIYTVHKTNVHDFSSSIELKELPGKTFNLIQFENIDSVSEEEIEKHPEYCKYH